MSERWTIDQLAALVEASLEATGSAAQSSGRVRSVPDLRTIRYYTTLGLISPPSEMQGRKAFYGRRHVLQIVAIKRLQARGLSLAEVQQAMLGASEKNLAEVAGLPPEVWGRIASSLSSDGKSRPPDAAPPMAARERQAASDRFWAATPRQSEAASPKPPVKPAKPSAAWALHASAGDGIEVVVHGIEPDRLTAQQREQLLARVEEFADGLREFCETRTSSSSGDGAT